ncbi:hypothetical protein AURDEDRAFT_187911 [Auricularia subglabra TFB-10046 SS5]|uniref:F-box domain-containing protein n=1 Tax=Auricularia subglabra (strain TFB-10046 / SS5) TaxID=717982 RepID=J0D0M0_AURST|nr:hypothetical protein AURDEDRAFT_187911 [Auricularia subglabra TFB-10046 SS5]
MGDVTRGLASELLTACLEYLDLSDVIAASHVSRFWRECALAFPTLWTRVTIDKAFSTCAHILHMAISRAGQLPVDLEYGRVPVEFEYPKPSRNVSGTAADAVARYMYRFRTFKWTHEVSALDLSRPAPLMREFVCGAGICAIPSDFLGGAVGRLRTLHIGNAVFPDSCPALETVVDLRVWWPDGLRCEPRFDHLFELFPRLELLNLRLTWVDRDGMPAGPAPRTLKSVKLTTYKNCDFGELYERWGLESTPDVHLTNQVEQAWTMAPVLAGALELSVIYAHVDYLSQSRIIARLPCARRRSVVCDDLMQVVDIDEVLSGVLADDAARLAHLQTLVIPIGVLTLLVPRWPCLARLTVHIFETIAWRFEDATEPAERFQWNRMDCLRAVHALTHLALCVHQDYEREIPPTLQDALELRQYLITLSACTPAEVLVYGFPDEVVKELLPREADNPRVLFILGHLDSG